MLAADLLLNRQHRLLNDARWGPIRRAASDVEEKVLQDLLTGVRDRVVVAVTFLAMLELVKQRELSVEQQEPWGPIVCRPATRPAVGVGMDSGTVAPS